MPSEGSFQSKLIKRLGRLFPEAIILKNDPNYLQGICDLTILFEDTWAVLEVKVSKDAPRRPNQPYYVDRLNDMSFARVIYPENEEHVIDELQQTFRSRGAARLLRR